MGYEIKYHPAVKEKDLPLIGQDIKKRIQKVISVKLMTRPEIFGIPLRYSFYGLRKIRIGDYRLIYEMQKSIIFVYSIGHRSIVYRDLLRRYEN